MSSTCEQTFPNTWFYADCINQGYRVRVKHYAAMVLVSWHINNEIYIQKTSLRGESLRFINFCLIAHETFVLNLLTLPKVLLRDFS